jgi:predicted MFS family arabinose efflux permease
LLFRHGSEVRILAILLLLQSLPQFMGAFFQIFANTEWKITTKEFSSFIAMWGVIGIVANTVGSVMVRRYGIKRFMAIATLSSMCAPIGASFFGFRGAVIGSVFGFLGAAQAMGIIAALVSRGDASGVPHGELAGERASLIALLKVFGPILYSTLYVQGRGKLGMKNLPFVFNIFLAAGAFVVSQLHLPREEKES